MQQLFYNLISKNKIIILEANVHSQNHLIDIKKKYQNEKKIMLLFGAESGKQDFPKELIQNQFFLPSSQKESIDSLNLSNFMAISLFHFLS